MSRPSEAARSQEGTLADPLLGGKNATAPIPPKCQPHGDFPLYMKQRTDFVPLPTTLFLEGLDTYVRRRLKARGDYQAGALDLDQPGGELELEDATLDLAEALMLADGVALKITGENVVLAFLTRTFGANPTAELIRSGVIAFVGQGNDAAAFVDPSSATLPDGSAYPPGNPILATIDYAAFEPHTFRGGRFDAEAAAVLALRRYKGQLALTRTDMRTLSRRAAKHTYVVPPERLAEVAQRVGAAYASDALTSLGLSPAIARQKNEYQDAAYVRLISRIAHTETLLDLDLDQYQMPDHWVAIRQFTEEISTGTQVLRSVDSIMELRGFADMRSLFRDRVLRIEDIPTLRKHPATAAFRQWLWSKPDPRDGPALAHDFIAELSGQSGAKLQSYLMRSVRIAGITFAQDAILNALQVSSAARSAADAGVAILSEFAIEKFKRKPPSAFLDELIQPAVHRARESANDT